MVRRGIVAMTMALSLVGVGAGVAQAEETCVGAEGRLVVCAGVVTGQTIPVDVSECVYVGDPECTPVEVHEEAEVPVPSCRIEGVLGTYYCEWTPI